MVDFDFLAIFWSNSQFGKFVKDRSVQVRYLRWRLQMKPHLEKRLWSEVLCFGILWFVLAEVAWTEKRNWIAQNYVNKSRNLSTKVKWNLFWFFPKFWSLQVVLREWLTNEDSWFDFDFCHFLHCIFKSKHYCFHGRRLGNWWHWLFREQNSTNSKHW